MNKILKLTIFAILFFTEISYGQDAATKNPIDQALLLEDYDFMLKTLEETHPNLYAYIPKEEFLAKTDELRKSINRPLSKPEFYKVLLQTVSLIKQGHTMVFGDPGFSTFLKEGGLSFPFIVKYDDSQIFIDENYSSNKSIIKGTELIAINRIPISQIIVDLTPYLKVRPNGFFGGTLEFNWAKYLWLVYGFESNFTISYILPNQDIIRTEIIDGISKEPKRKEDSNNEKFKLDIDQNRDLAVITLNTFEFDFEEYDSLLRSSFKSIKDNEIKNLIIDIRQNGGGNGNLINPLVDYLTDKPYITTAFSQIKTSEATLKCYTTHPVFINAIEQARKSEKNSEKFLQLVDAFLDTTPGTITNFPKEEALPTINENRFTSNLYVLTSRHTFSAATGFCVTIKDNKIGYIVGEETSDNPTDYGCIMLFELPNTKINIQNSTQYSVRPAGYNDEHGVIPDFIVKPTFSEFLNGTDKVMNYTYWMIENEIK